MRCKPGDLAVIVDDDFKENIGALVKVIGVGPRSEDGEWLVDPVCHIRVEVEEWGGVISGEEVVGPGAPDIYLLDCGLRPLRDPGDDARDDAWDWLPPVPNDISAEDPQDLREALKQWAEEQR